MPGESRGDVPAAVPLQIALQASGASLTNSHTPAACAECKKPSTIVCGGCWQLGFCARDHQLSGWEKHRPKCRPWRIGCSSELGRFMVATRDIAAGELLLEDQPLLLGPKMITEPVCLGCYRPVNGDYQCQSCGFPLCGPQCEDTDDHEAECKAVRDSGIPVKVSVFGEINSMYECITPVRILALRDDAPSVWNKLMTLESNSDMRDGTEVAAITQQTVVDIIHDRLRLEQFDTEIIEKVLGIIDTNGFEIRLPDSSILGVYATASMLEHDCVTNTHRTFDADLNLVVRAAIPIKRGDHLTSCYTDPLTTTATRQEHLRSSKYFICRCKRCVDPTELKTYVSALICADCVKKQAEEESKKKSAAQGKQAGGRASRGKPGGVMSRINQIQSTSKGDQSSSKEGGAESSEEPGPWIVPQDPLSPSSNWKCLSCGYPTTDDYPDRITEVVAEEAEELEASSATVAQCEAFLEKWNHLFHQDHAIFINIKYALLHLYGSEDGYELDDLSPIHLARKEELCRQVLKIADVLVPGISRLRGSVLYELYQALYYKAQALFTVGAATSEQARRIAMDAMTALKECARILSYEPEVQPEGQLGLEAKDEIKKLQQWIKEEGWKF
ncbi:hypothetical protein OTU49_015582 [Cherax quadricarinatus]|uniref:Uncharacterized protein n=1 Tax=Cherax quadricarinatus TaxID=27406 RepID=A0AAW0YCY5_CHEQU|nr:uncharacterized protein LOC128686054 [Cherax quadricarinatus]XP_053628670.1 uncharacterized protein LOC128686054 [Cherax quadricarinatus]